MNKPADDEQVLLRGDKVIHLDDRLSIIERKLNLMIVVVGVLTVDHLSTLLPFLQWLEHFTVK